MPSFARRDLDVRYVALCCSHHPNPFMALLCYCSLFLSSDSLLSIAEQAREDPIIKMVRAPLSLEHWYWYLRFVVVGFHPCVIIAADFVPTLFSSLLDGPYSSMLVGFPPRFTFSDKRIGLHISFLRSGTSRRHPAPEAARPRPRRPG